MVTDDLFECDEKQPVQTQRTLQENHWSIYSDLQTIIPQSDAGKAGDADT